MDAFGIGLQEAAILVVPAVILGTIIYASARIGGFGSADRWANGHGLVLTETSRPMVYRYLGRARRFRIVGALVAYLASIGLTLATGGQHVAIGFWQLIMIGYLTGTVVAELSLRRPPPGTMRSASLSPRGVHDYLPAWTVWGTRIAATASIGLALGAGISGASLTGLRFPWFVTLALVAVGLNVVLEILERTISGRPQPVVSDDLLVADQAIRASSIHAVGGAGLAIVLLIVSAQCAALSHRAPSAGPWGGSWFGWAALLTFALAMFVWLLLGRADSWQVRRTEVGSQA